MRLLVLIGTFSILSSLAQAFPEMIRWGYVNCTSCHVSPTGGGLLTDYGRSISAEVLSVWTKSKEEMVGHGALPEPPSWLKLGGDLRLIQTYVDTPQSTATHFFPMQMDVEVGFQFDRLWWVQSFGMQGGPSSSRSRAEFVARNFYALYNVTEESFLRAGKYLMPYGLNLPDHTSLVRRNLGFDQGHETYVIDGGYLAEKWNANIALNLGRKDPVQGNLEKGASIQLGYNLGDTQKLQGSFSYLEKDSSTSRFILGPQWVWGFHKKWVFLGELTYQEKRLLIDAKKILQKGAVTYARLQYEWLRGLHSYFLHQGSYLDFTRLDTRVIKYGAGFLLYPRPHFELTGEVSYQEIAVVHSYSTVSWLVGHYYF